MSPQPYPHVFRPRGAFSNCDERSFELDGAQVITHRWRYEGGWTRAGLRSQRQRHPSARAARAALDDAVAKLLAQGWGALPDWPHTPGDWFDPRRIAEPPPERRKPKPERRRAAPAIAPIALSRLRVVGRAQPVAASRLAAVEAALDTATPRSWRALLGRLGPGAFAGRLRVSSPEAVVRETRSWRRNYRGAFRTFFANHDEVLGEEARSLVTLASSIEGDRVGFLAGAPARILILPRNDDRIVVTKGMPEVLGWYARVAREVDDAPPTYAPLDATVTAPRT
jgi:hypothetical protein